MSPMSNETSVPAGKYHVFTRGQRLAAARASITDSQAEFGALIGIARRSVSRYETDQAEPKKPVLEAWAKYTGYDEEWLRSGKIPEPQGGGDPNGGNVVPLKKRGGDLGSATSLCRRQILADVADLPQAA